MPNHHHDAAARAAKILLVLTVLLVGCGPWAQDTARQRTGEMTDAEGRIWVEVPVEKVRDFSWTSEPVKPTTLITPTLDEPIVAICPHCNQDFWFRVKVQSVTRTDLWKPYTDERGHWKKLRDLR